VAAADHAQRKGDSIGQLYLSRLFFGLISYGPGNKSEISGFDKASV